MVNTLVTGVIATSIHSEIQDPSISKFIPRLSLFKRDSLSGIKAPANMAVAA